MELDEAAEEIRALEERNRILRRNEFAEALRKVADWVSGDLVDNEEEEIERVASMVDRVLKEHAMRTKIFSAAIIKKHVQSIVDLAEDIDHMERYMREELRVDMMEPKDIISLYNALTGRQERLLKSVAEATEADYPKEYTPPAQEDKLKRVGEKHNLDKLTPQQRENVAIAVAKIKGLLGKQ